MNDSQGHGREPAKWRLAGVVGLQPAGWLGRVAVGAIIGKSLQTLPAGQSLIPVLVALQ